MNLRFGALAASALGAVVVAAIAVALLSDCGGGTGGGPTDVPIPTDPSGTPVTFEALRDDLADELDAIGPNIGAVPADVKQDLLIRCGQLTNFVDRDEIAPLCNAINNAIERGDPGLVDIIVTELRALDGS